MKVKLYITMEGIGDKCTNQDISLDFTENSFSLLVNNFLDEPQVLCFTKLTAAITEATFRLKQDRIILTLKKAQEGEWHTINDK
jgi:hypothetical protein